MILLLSINHSFESNLPNWQESALFKSGIKSLSYQVLCNMEYLSLNIFTSLLFHALALTQIQAIISSLTSS